jgi:extradiol dioxygenase
MPRIGYVGVQSTAHAEWTRFGPRVFGFESGRRGDGTVRVRWDDRAYRLAVHPGRSDRLCYLGWELDAGESLDDVAAGLAGRGYPPRVGSARLAAERAAGRLVWFEDPFGLRHELVDGEAEPLGAYRGHRATSGTVTGEFGMGDVVLDVPDLDRALTFYLDVLGMKVSDAIHLGPPLGEMWILRYHPRQHSIRLLETPGRHGLRHLVVEARHLADVEIAWDVARRETDSFMSPGRRASDNMLLFRVRTPAGFDMCYGWGAARAHDSGWAPRYLVR